MSATAVREPVTRLAPLERLEALCDPGSLQIVRSRVSSARLGARAEPGDGVLGATGLVAGRPVACYAQDGRFLGGSYRRELRVASHPEAERARRADAYAGEHLRADAAAAEGFVDELVEPVETRSRLAGALRTLAGDRG